MFRLSSLFVLPSSRTLRDLFRLLTFDYDTVHTLCRKISHCTKITDVFHDIHCINEKKASVEELANTCVLFSLIVINSLPLFYCTNFLILIWVHVVIQVLYTLLFRLLFVHLCIKCTNFSQNILLQLTKDVKAAKNVNKFLYLCKAQSLFRMFLASTSYLVAINYEVEDLPQVNLLDSNADIFILKKKFTIIIIVKLLPLKYLK